jgi:hypothetical protein
VGQVLVKDQLELPPTEYERWRAYRTDDLRLREPPALAVFCPSCAELEFGND